MFSIIYKQALDDWISSSTAYNTVTMALIIKVIYYRFYALF